MTTTTKCWTAMCGMKHSYPVLHKIHHSASVGRFRGSA
jgi:hypothetical protein